MSANPLVVSLSHLLKPHEDQHELKKDLIGQVAMLVKENYQLREEMVDLREDKKILERYRHEMEEISRITEDKVEDFLDIIPYIKELDRKLTEAVKIICLACKERSELKKKLEDKEERLEQAEESLENAGYKWDEENEWYSCD